MSTIKYTRSLSTFFIKGKIITDQNFVTFKEPKGILGIIPFGGKTEKHPVTQIASVATNMSINFKALFIAIFWAALTGVFVNIGDSSLAAVELFCAVATFAFLLDAFEQNLVLTFSSGEERRINFFFDMAKAKKAEKEINNLIAGRLWNTNVQGAANRIIGVFRAR